jgi:heme-degrading monooxygenase HmoA
MAEKRYHLVHANLAKMRAPLDDPQMADFVRRAGLVDVRAEAAPGFVSMPVLPDSGSCYREPYMLNVSIWESAASLKAFTYRGEHANAFRKRGDWFEKIPGPNYVLFWHPAGEIPTEAEIDTRFKRLETEGETPLAFSFKRPYSIEEILDQTKDHETI